MNAGVIYIYIYICIFTPKHERHSISESDIQPHACFPIRRGSAGGLRIENTSMTRRVRRRAVGDILKLHCPDHPTDEEAADEINGIAVKLPK